MENWTPETLQQHLDQNGRVFLKLWKKSCGICKLSEPATDRLEKSNSYQLTFAKISIDDFPEMMDLSGTDVLPAFFVFADKKKQGQLVGFKGLKKLEEFLEGCFSKSRT